MLPEQDLLYHWKVMYDMGSNIVLVNSEGIYIHTQSSGTVNHSKGDSDKTNCGFTKFRHKFPMQTGYLVGRLFY